VSDLKTLWEVAIVVGIIWMLVSMYCLLMLAFAARNAMRMIVAWYQDWFDSVFEEGDSPEPEGSRATPAREEPRAAVAARADPAPRAAQLEEPESRGPATGAGTKPGFKRRTHT
jgi:hypothetical protein